jgi:hypothetical protein
MAQCLAMSDRFDSAVERKLKSKTDVAPDGAASVRGPK